MFSEMYRFGGIVYAVECEENIEKSEICAPFTVTDCAADHTIRLRFDNAIPEKPEMCAVSGPLSRWYDGSARHTLQCYSAPGSTPQFTYAVTDGSETQLTFAEKYRIGASVRSALESACLFDLLSDAGMLILHSSYIVTEDGEAVIFSGPSGVGKSTQAALWEKYLGANIINGDRSLLCPDECSSNGIFYSGTSGICKNVSAPIKAIVLLGQAEDNSVQPINPSAAFARILSQCAYYAWDTPSAIRMTDHVARLISNAQVLRFDCRADESAVRALQEKLGGI